MAKRYLETVNPLDYLDEEEMDAVRAALAYVLIKNTDMDKELIYSLVFENGRRITWH